MSAVEVCVVGSANLDIVVPVPRHPVPGETVLGGDHARIPGGKGANQAVAAARLGRRVGFVGCIGNDAAGVELHDALDGDGVDVSNLRIVDEAPSGIALISVGPDGDNSIVVSPGANAHVGEADIERAAPMLQSALVTLLQLEVPVDAVIEAHLNAEYRVGMYGFAPGYAYLAGVAEPIQVREGRPEVEASPRSLTQLERTPDRRLCRTREIVVRQGRAERHQQ